MEIFIFDIDKMYPDVSPTTKEEVATNYAKMTGKILWLGSVVLGIVQRVERHETEIRLYVQLRNHVERGSTV